MHTSSNDRDTIRENQVEGIVRDICVSYSLLRRSFLKRFAYIDAKLSQGDISAVVTEMISIYKVPKGFIKRIGYAAKIDSPAMLQMVRLNYAERPQSAELFFQASKEGLTRENHYLVLHMIAHELAHARLYLDGHRHRHSEFATDVLGLMVVGDSVNHSAIMTTVQIDGYVAYTSEYGYIRQELRQEVYRCLKKYTDTVYL